VDRRSARESGCLTWELPCPTRARSPHAGIPLLFDEVAFWHPHPHLLFISLRAARPRTCPAPPPSASSATGPTASITSVAGAASATARPSTGPLRPIVVVFDQRRLPGADTPAAAPALPSARRSPRGGFNPTAALLSARIAAAAACAGTSPLPLHGLHARVAGGPGGPASRFVAAMPSAARGPSARARSELADRARLPSGALGSVAAALVPAAMAGTDDGLRVPPVASATALPAGAVYVDAEDGTGGYPTVSMAPPVPGAPARIARVIPHVFDVPAAALIPPQPAPLAASSAPLGAAVWMGRHQHSSPCLPAPRPALPALRETDERA